MKKLLEDLARIQEAAAVKRSLLERGKLDAGPATSEETISKIEEALREATPSGAPVVRAPGARE